MVSGAFSNSPFCLTYAICYCKSIIVACAEIKAISSVQMTVCNIYIFQLCGDSQAHS